MPVKLAGIAQAVVFELLLRLELMGWSMRVRTFIHEGE
jgi:hypothetical protein